MQLKIRHNGQATKPGQPGQSVSQVKQNSYLHIYIYFLTVQFAGIVYRAYVSATATMLAFTLKGETYIKNHHCYCKLSLGRWRLYDCHLLYRMFWLFKCEHKQIRKNPYAADKKQIHIECIYTMHRIGHELFDNICWNGTTLLKLFFNVNQLKERCFCLWSTNAKIFHLSEFWILQYSINNNNKHWREKKKSDFM